MPRLDIAYRQYVARRDLLTNMLVCGGRDDDRHRLQDDKARALRRLLIEVRYEEHAGPCPVCGRKNAGDSGDYYHLKQCTTQHLLDWLEDIPGNRQDNMDLNRDLAMARYTGD